MSRLRAEVQALAAIIVKKPAKPAVLNKRVEVEVMVLSSKRPLRLKVSAIPAWAERALLPRARRRARREIVKIA